MTKESKTLPPPPTADSFLVNTPQPKAPVETSAKCGAEPSLADILLKGASLKNIDVPEDTPMTFTHDESGDAMELHTSEVPPESPPRPSTGSEVNCTAGEPAFKEIRVDSAPLEDLPSANVVAHSSTSPVKIEGAPRSVLSAPTTDNPDEGSANNSGHLSPALSNSPHVNAIEPPPVFKSPRLKVKFDNRLQYKSASFEDSDGDEELIGAALEADKTERCVLTASFVGIAENHRLANSRAKLANLRSTLKTVDEKEERHDNVRLSRRNKEPGMKEIIDVRTPPDNS